MNLEGVAQAQVFDHSVEVARALNNGSFFPNNVVRVRIYKLPSANSLYQDILNIAFKKASPAAHCGVINMTMSKSTSHVAFTVVYDSKESMEAGKRYIDDAHKRLADSNFKLEFDDGADMSDPLILAGA